MKIIPLGSIYINLDQVEQINENNELIMSSGRKIKLSSEELEQFIRMYNLYDTDHDSFLIKKAAEVLFNNPTFMTREGMENDIRLKVERYDLKRFVIDYNKGKKIRELNHNELVNLYKAVTEEADKMLRGGMF